MVTFEIARIHQRQQDYRNAYTTMVKLVKVRIKLSHGLQKYPNNPHILSRMGRLCLEAGRKQEAVDHFNKIQKMMKNQSSSEPLGTNKTSPQE